MRPVQRLSLVGIVLLALSQIAYADFSVVIQQRLTLEYAGVEYAGYEGDASEFVPTVKLMEIQ